MSAGSVSRGMSAPRPAPWRMRATSWSKWTARGSGYGAGCFSKMATRQPRCPSSIPSVCPTGPYPTIARSRSSMRTSEAQHVERRGPVRKRRSRDELLEGRAGPIPRQHVFRIEQDADRVLREVRAAHPVVQLLDVREVVDLELDPVSVGVLVVHRRRWPVVDAPVGEDALAFEAQVRLEQVAEIRMREGDVIGSRGTGGAVLEPREVRDRDPVM